MKKIVLAGLLFLTITIFLAAKEWVVVIGDQVLVYTTEHEFRHTNITIATEYRDVCRQGIPVYYAFISGGIDTGERPISPDVYINVWSIAKKTLATDEQLRLAIQEGYWTGVWLPKFVPPKKGNFQELRAGEYTYFNINGHHYLIETLLTSPNAPMWNF